jgi:hypothetical protein
MPVAYVIDTTRKLIHINCSGVVTLADVLDHCAKLKNDPACAGHLDVMLDVRESDTLPESKDLRIANSNVASVRGKVEFGRFAIVANRDAMFGMMRMFGIFAEKDFREINVFRGTVEAEVWLALQQVQDETRSLS